MLEHAHENHESAADAARRDVSGCTGRLHAGRDDRRAAIQAARQGELTTVGSVDALLSELNAPDDDAPASAGGKLFCELVREYLRESGGDAPIEPSDRIT